MTTDGRITQALVLFRVVASGSTCRHDWVVPDASDALLVMAFWQHTWIAYVQ